MNDTSERIERVHRDMLMSLSGEERFRMGAEMFGSALRLMRAGIEAAHGPLSEVEMRERLLRRLYGDELSEEARRAVARRVPTPGSA